MPHRVVCVVERVVGQGYSELLRNPDEAVATPAVAKRDRDRHDLWPTAQRELIEIAYELREQVVWVQLLDEQPQERARATEFRLLGSKGPHRLRAYAVAPPFDV